MSCPYLPSKGILLVSTWFSKTRKNLANDNLGEQRDSMGELIRMPQDQPQNLPSDTCHTSGETLSAKKSEKPPVLSD